MNLLNHQLGPYTLTEILGQGASATVYKAYQAGVERHVALKVLSPHIAHTPDLMGRFEQEARLLANLQHPYILPVHDYGQDKGLPYIVMPCLQNGSLADQLDGQPLPLPQIQRIIGQLGDALDYAHSRGLIHRDLKPGNILLDERGNCLLTDFGIAKIIGGQANFTTEGGIIGTPAYMSPEQALGEPLDARSDLYALGVILYQLATGELPFQADNPLAVVLKHVRAIVPAPRRIRPELPPPLETIILKSLAKSPADRFDTAESFAHAVLQIASVDEANSALTKLAVTSLPAPLRKTGPDVSVSALIARWHNDGRFMACVSAWRTLPARTAAHADWPSDLDGRVIQAAQQLGVARPYTHQAEAITAALNHKHVVMVTATASGKTLGYNAPILHSLLNQPQTRALYLFPTKALAQDQMVVFNELVAALSHQSKLYAATYDGDTPQSARRKIRTTAPVIVSNPDMLHLSILPHHPRWRKFLANLRYIVIDELHTYRGAFGSHFANVLRRLQRICAFYGAKPQFICASATIANPVQHTLNLLDLVEPHRLHIVDRNGAPQARKHLVFYNPPIIDEQMGLRRGAVVTANELARELLAAQAKTVVFARARLTVEVLLTYLQDFVQQNAWPAETVRGYRGGYLPLARREIETGLREGSVQGVVATNALELGVDIGSLTACVLTGYPGTIASTWQQVGRAGRRASESVAVLVATPAPLDQFLMKHPEFFFDRTAEHARIDPDNPMIALSHLQCAAYELPFQADEPFGHFPNPRQYLDFLVEEGSLREASGRYHWVGEDNYPAQQVDLRSAGLDNVVITTIPAGETIGEVDVLSAPRFIHPGAIYLHEGESYQILSLDLVGGRAEATPVTVGYYTRALSETSIKVLETAETASSTHLDWGRGLVRVGRQVTGFKQIRRYTHEIIGFGDVDLPEHTFDTSGYWLTMTEDLLDTLRSTGIWLGKLDYGPAALWQQRRAAALARDGYRCQVCGKAEAEGQALHVHHLRPLREFLAEGARKKWPPETIYKEAHALSNLMTLCPSCHRRAEVVGQTATAWGGLAHALGNLAPLFVMCDPRDIGVTYDSALDSLPTITLYDATPMGLGLTDQLYDLHKDLLTTVTRLVRDCSCQQGCPACVGPTFGPEVNLRAETQALLIILQD